MEEKKKSRDFTPRHFALAFFGLLVVILTFMGIMSWQSYVMIDMGTEFLLFGVLIVGAMAVGLYFMIRRMPRKAARVITGVLGGLLIAVVAVVMMALFTFILSYNTPEQFTVLTSPGGEKVVVMRKLNFDGELMRVRAEARGETDPDELSQDDVGYSYFAAPKVLGMFYDADAKGEGSVDIGVMSEAKLMYDWEGETLKMYIENPEPGDRGEIILNME